MSTFIIWVAFVACREFFNLSEDASLIIAGVLAFAFREVLDLLLAVMKNPAKIKDFLIKK
jgi:hypothetical protein